MLNGGLVLQLALDTLATAGIYAIVGIGVFIAHSGTRVLHLAIGEVAMAGALVAAGLATMNFTRRQQLVRTVIDKVIVSESRVEILFNIPLPDAPKEGRSPAAQVNRLRPQRQGAASARTPS